MRCVIRPMDAFCRGVAQEYRYSSITKWYAISGSVPHFVEFIEVLHQARRDPRCALPQEIGAADEDMKAKFAGMRYGDLKKQVAEMVIVSLEPIQKRYNEIVADPGYLNGILRESAVRVRPMALETVEMVKQRMGLYTIS